MKFDAVIGNPPYQKSANSGSPIWQDFPVQALNVTEDGGRVAMIHPPRWRGVGKTNPAMVGKLGDMLKALDIEWLSIHNLDDGRRNFNAGIRYDMYIVRNRSTPDFETEIRDENGETIHECVKGMDFIPNCDFGLAESLIAKEGEERAKVVYSKSMYFSSDRSIMSHERTDEFQFPCIHSISLVDASLNVRWSNRKLDFFGVPKVVFGIAHSSGIPHVDREGEYGLTEMAAGLLDDPDNMDSMAKAMDSDGFRRVMQSVQFSTEKWNRNVIAMFRRDFWREFI